MANQPVTRRGGKKNRKHGRNRNSAAMKRYVAENRLEKNKARHIAKAARQARKKAR